MSRVLRGGLAALTLLGAACLVPPAQADDGIARRLAVLKMLVDPGATSSRRPPPQETGKGECATPAWSRATAYGERSRIDAAVRDASRRFAVSPELIRSVIRHESAYDVRAVSSAGAMGLMQLMPATARELGVSCPFDPRENVLGGTRYLRQLHDRLGSWPRTVAAYHAGPSRVESGRIPRTTQRYVKAVLGTWRPGRYTGWSLR